MLSTATPQSCRFSSRFPSGTISIGVWGNALTLHTTWLLDLQNGKLKWFQCSQFNILSFDLYFLLFFKASVQSCSLKLLPNVVPRSCSPTLCPTDLLQSFSPKPASLHQKRLPKAILHSGARKRRLKVATRSYTPKRLPKDILQSGSRKLLPNVAP